MAHQTRLFPYFNLVLCVKLNPPCISLERLFRRDVADRSSQRISELGPSNFLSCWLGVWASARLMTGAMQPPQMFHQYPLSPAPDPKTGYPPPLPAPGADHHVRSFEASSGGRINGQQEAAETERNETIWSISNVRLNFCGAIELFRSTALFWPYFLLMIPRTTRQQPHVMGHENPDAWPLSKQSSSCGRRPAKAYTEDLSFSSSAACADYVQDPCRIMASNRNLRNTQAGPLNATP